MTHQLSLGEWTHDNDTQTKIGGQRQDLTLNLTLQRIIGNLDGGNATRQHDALQFSKEGTTIVRGTNCVHLSGIAQSLQHREMLLPEHQVVDLVKTDVLVQK